MNVISAVRYDYVESLVYVAVYKLYCSMPAKLNYRFFPLSLLLIRSRADHSIIRQYRTNIQPRTTVAV